MITNLKMIELLKEVNCIDIKNNQYLIACYNAMKYIGENYKSVITKTIEKRNDEIAIEIYERNYIIYLTYVIGLIQGKCSNVLEKEDFINGEIYKEIEILPDESAKKAYHQFLEIKNKKEIKKKDNCSDETAVISMNEHIGQLIPDFLIHISHKKDNDYRGQKFIIEAKTTSKLQEIPFCWDLLKLNIYVNSLNFDNAAYIILNSSVEKINTLLAYYILNIDYYEEALDKIWFFVQNWDSKNESLLSPKIFKLDKENILIFRDRVSHQAHK
jgi:hypothetical protein